MTEFALLQPEPPQDGTYVVAGDAPNELVYVRQGDGDDPPQPERWWPLLGYESAPVEWQDVAAPLTVDASGNVRRQPRRVEILVRASAVPDRSVMPVGPHLVEQGGYCRTCSSYHSPTEIARIEDQEAADA